MRALCEEFGIEILYAFGSRSREVAEFLSGRSDLSESDSDVDLVVKPKKGKQL